MIFIHYRIGLRKVLPCRYSTRHTHLTIIILSVLFYFNAFATPASQADDLRTIPDSLISMGEKENTPYAVVVDKHAQQLFLYGYDGSYKQIYRFDCSTGEVEGAKLRSGDKKTPEGVYSFTEKFEKRYLSAVYGIRAFPMDYPNYLDVAAGRNGNSIWLHGTNKPLKPLDSNGCIVLANEDIDRLTPYITLNRTPIIVVDKLNFVPMSKRSDTKAAVTDFLSKWHASLQSGTYHDYLKHYDPEYAPDISWWNDWRKIKQKLASDHPKFSIELKPPAIYKNNNIYVALFDQMMHAGGEVVSAGTRKLFLITRQDSFRVIADEYQGLSKKQKADKTFNHLVTACRDLTGILDADHQITELIEKWRHAWSAKNIKKYGSCYATDFRSDGKNLKSWLAHKN